MLSSRVRFLKQTLKTLGYYDSLRALDLMIEEMCAEKEYKRHNGTHYYYHLVDVAQKLLNFRVRDEITITAAILHDFIEDVPWANYEIVKRMFCKEVADTVQILTKDPNIDYKNDKEALKQYVWRCAENVRTALIKTADRIHNFGTLGDCSFEKQLRQALETEEIFIPFFKYCRNAYPEYSDFFFEAKTQIEPHLYKIKECARIIEELEKLQKENMELRQKLAKYENQNMSM